MKFLNKKDFLKRTTLLGIRGVGIFSRFLLTFLITKKISLDFQGSFSLVNTSITLLVLFFGLDFYVYSNKLIIQNREKALFYFKNNLIFYLFVYVIFIPILFFLFKLLMPNVHFSLGLLFFVIILEHLGQEFFRIFIALQRVYFANILLFIRTGLWAMFVVLYLFFADEIDLTINDLLWIWSLSALFTVVLSFYFFPDIKNIFKVKTDFIWIKKGFKVAGQMFLATIFLKVIELSDRYIIDLFYDKEAVGIYSFYFQLANLSNVIIFTLYISFLYPKLIYSINKADDTEVLKIQNEIKQKVLIVITITSIVFFVILPYLLDFINRSQLYQYKFLLFGLLIANAFLNLSYIGHFTLIGYNQEKKILKITFYCFIVSLTFNFLLIKYFGLWGALATQITASLFMFILKHKAIKNKNFL